MKMPLPTTFQRCEQCNQPLPPTRTKPGRYCSSKCRQAAYRGRSLLSPVGDPVPAPQSRSTSPAVGEFSPEAGPSGKVEKSAPKSALLASTSPAVGEIRNASNTIPLRFVTQPPEEAAGAASRWLWVDPHHEDGYNPVTFDTMLFLRRAMDLFQRKQEWGGLPPDSIRAHPDQAGNGLRPVAEALGLRIVVDARVMPSSYWLGVMGELKGSEEG